MRGITNRDERLKMVICLIFAIRSSAEKALKQRNVREQKRRMSC